MNIKNSKAELYLFTSHLNETELHKSKILATLEGVDLTAFSKEPGLISRDYMHTTKLKGTFDTKLSPDSSKILVSYLIDTKGQSETQTVFLQVWSEAFTTLLWEKKIELPLNKKKNYFHAANIDNNGNVYLLFNTQYMHKRMLIYEKYSLVRITEFGEVVNTNTLDFGDNTVKDMNIFFDNSGDMIALGYWHQLNNPLGIAIAKYPLSEQSPLPVKCITFDGKPAKKKSNFVANYLTVYIPGNGLKLHAVIPEENGGFTLIGELQYLEYHQSSSRSNVTQVYHYDHVFVSRVDSDGKVLYENMIIKRQTQGTSTSQYCSISYMKRGKDLLIFHNDHADNILKDKGFHKSFPTYKSKAVLVMTTINEKGKKSQEIIANFKEDDVYINAANLKVASNDEIFLGVYRDKKYGIVKVKW